MFKLAFLLLVAQVAFSQDSNPTGFASMNGGTTGGAGGPTVLVSTEAELVAAVAGNDPKIVKITKHIVLTDLVRPGSNKSILGTTKDSGVSNSGFYIRRVSNVILRGLKIFKSVAPDDGVSIDESLNVWIDHCEFYSDLDHDKDYYDGLLDAKHGADYITVSWNKFHTHYKTSLVGHSDSNESEDKGKLRITYHNNYFTNTESRLPSLRFGTGHIFNNVYENIATSGINSRMGAQVLVEGNVFDNVKRALVTNLDSAEEGYAVERNNIWRNAAPEITKEGTFTSPPYTYTVEAADKIESIVKAQAGNTIQFP
jgi:pectate lyase